MDKDLLLMMFEQNKMILHHNMQLFNLMAGGDSPAVVESKPKPKRKTKSKEVDLNNLTPEQMEEYGRQLDEITS